MKPIFLSIYIWIMFCSASCNNGQSVKGETGGSSSEETKTTLQDDDIIRLQPFNIKDYQKEQNYKAAKDIKLQKVGIADLKKMIGLADYTWIVVWASWCPHCREGLNHYPGTTEKVNKLDENMNMILVAEDYNLPMVQQRMFDIGYKKQVYVLDPEEFGMDEEAKITKLRQYLCPTCSKVDAVVPQHYLFNKNGQIVLNEVGGDVTDINIMTAISSTKN
ncbi:MAG: hypothetical protein EOP53_00125 [Sphingobacteriales bacterium]|nr:MAG: hypothetical protein EOP53_00125 [Sphingobacteriales bacterium]